MVSTLDREILLEERQVVTPLQEYYGTVGQVVLVMVQNLVVQQQEYLVHQDVSLDQEDEVHGVMVQPQDQVVVLQVYS